MAEKTKIAWADSTFNPWIGCTKVGRGCDNCYAEAFAKRVGKNVWGNDAPRELTKGPWNDVLKWQRDAGKFFVEHGRKRRVFCASLADVFDNKIDPAWRKRLWKTVKACPDLNFLFVTKRVSNVAGMGPMKQDDDYPDRWWHDRFPKNVGVMATIVNQEEADRDIPKLLEMKRTYSIRWVGLSMEPLLGPVELTGISNDGTLAWDWFKGNRKTIGDDGFLYEDFTDYIYSDRENEGLDWIIAGGESGQGARPMHPDWARSLRDQCAAAGVPFFFKQWGAWAPGEWSFDLDDHLHFLPDDPRVPVDGLDDEKRAPDRMIWSEGERTPEGRGYLNVGKKAAGRLLDGIEHNGMPQVRP